MASDEPVSQVNVIDERSVVIVVDCDVVESTVIDATNIAPIDTVGIGVIDVIGVTTAHLSFMVTAIAAAPGCDVEPYTPVARIGGAVTGVAATGAIIRGARVQPGVKAVFQE